MDLKMGHTAITCRKCKAVNAVENEVLESMREYVCPVCGERMTDYELSSLKLKYYLMLTAMFDSHWGSVKQYEKFDWHINLWPHYEVKERENEQKHEE